METSSAFDLIKALNELGFQTPLHFNANQKVAASVNIGAGKVIAVNFGAKGSKEWSTFKQEQVRKAYMQYAAKTRELMPISTTYQKTLYTDDTLTDEEQKMGSLAIRVLKERWEAKQQASFLDIKPLLNQLGFRTSLCYQFQEESPLSQFTVCPERKEIIVYYNSSFPNIANIYQYEAEVLLLEYATYCHWLDLADNKEKPYYHESHSLYMTLCEIQDIEKDIKENPQQYFNWLPNKNQKTKEIRK